MTKLEELKAIKDQADKDYIQATYYSSDVDDAITKAEAADKANADYYNYLKSIK